MIKKTLKISILYKGAHATIISLLPAKNHQIPLIHIVHEDDVVLLNTQDAEWFKILYHFPWKLEQFDQIMRESGLWNKIKVEEVRRNIERGVIKKEEELVGDTTHYHAYSGFEVVRYADEKEKEPKKSRSKPTKRCRCKDRQTCGHEWELADEGAGTIVKSGQKMRRKNRYV